LGGAHSATSIGSQNLFMKKKVEAQFLCSRVLSADLYIQNSRIRKPFKVTGLGVQPTNFGQEISFPILISGKKFLILAFSG
jgi:hypothetical protein